MSQRTAYLCGNWVAEHQLALPVGDLGVSMGVTVTERLRTFGGKLFRKREHLDRLRQSLAIINMDAEPITAEIDEAIEQYLVRHREQMLPGDDWAVVVFATPGSGSGPTVCVHGMPLPFADWAEQYQTGVPTFTSHHRQVPPNCWPAELKCRSRMHYYLAETEAREHRPGARAVLLDQEGFVGEASTANLVSFHRQTGLATPRRTKVLPGVSVAVIANLASQLGVPFVERDITLEEFRAADEVWLTSTSICMLPVVSHDEQPIGNGQPGAVYAKFLKAWGELTGVEITKQAESFATRD